MKPGPDQRAQAAERRHAHISSKVLLREELRQPRQDARHAPTQKEVHVKTSVTWCTTKSQSSDMPYLRAIGKQKRKSLKTYATNIKQAFTTAHDGQAHK